MTKEKAVVLCSGGLNSAVAAKVAATDYALAMLHVKFGHRAAERDAKAFAEQAEYFKPAHQLVIDMPHFSAMGGNGRVSKKIAIEDAMALSEGRCNTNIPGLVHTLIGAAFTWATTLGANRIFLGIAEDLGPPAPRLATLYPEYGREFVELCRHAIAAAHPERPVEIETPLAELTRNEVIRLGMRMHVPLELTWSCIASSSAPCGVCLGCATRHRGFLDAALPDPLLAGTHR